MSKALTPALAVTSRATIRRRRDLPIAGEVLVREGDLVAGSQVVARAQLDGELRLVRVAELLGIPASDLPTVLRVAEVTRSKRVPSLQSSAGFGGSFEVRSYLR